MTFTNPWALWLVVPLVAVAAWVLFRPSRREVVVGSLRLWRAARAAVASDAVRRRRRVNLAWVLLLAGGVSGVLACAGWTLRPERHGRVVAVVVVSSAELANAMDELREAADGLLDRLDANDRVHVVAPRWAFPGHATSPAVASVAASQSVSPARAKEIIASLRPVPILAATLRGELVPPATADHVYILGPRPIPADTARVSHIPVRLPGVSRMPAPRVSALAATPLPDGNVQMFLRTSAPLLSMEEVHVYAPSIAAASSENSPPVTIIAEKFRPVGHSHEDNSVLLELPARDAYFVIIMTPRGDANMTRRNPLAQAGLVRREVVRVNIAMVGKASPLMERLILKNAGWEKVENPADADVVIAVQAAVPAAAASKPVLMIDPPSPPVSWQRGEERGPVLLAQAAVANDPVTAGADVARVSVRRVRPFVPVDALQTQGRPLVREGGGALILRSGGDAPHRLDGPLPPRRVDIAFDIDRLNTDWGLDASFVVLMCNAMDWLAGRPPADDARSAAEGDARHNRDARYEYVTPEQAGPSPEWHAVALDVGGYPFITLPSPKAASPLPWPGLYRDAAGQWHGVFIPDQAGMEEEAELRDASNAATNIAALPLPAPKPLTEPLSLWPWLLTAAATLWLSGWWLRR